MHTAKLKYRTKQFFIYRVSLVRLLVCWLVLMQANVNGMASKGLETSKLSNYEE